MIHTTDAVVVVVVVKATTNLRHTQRVVVLTLVVVITARSQSLLWNYTDHTRSLRLMSVDPAISDGQIAN